MAPPKPGVWERGFTDLKGTMEDLIAKLTQRLDEMNTDIKDSLREINAALKAQDDKIDAIRQKT